MADAYTRAQTAQFIGGALDTFARFGLQQLYRKNEQERLATMEVAGRMAEQGMLDTLPDNVWKQMSKNMGQNYADLLMQRSSLRKRILAPRRTLMQGVKDIVGAPMYELVPGQQKQPLPTGDTLDEQMYGPDTWPANRPPATRQMPIPVGNQQQYQTLQQRAQQQAQQTGVNPIEGYQIATRNPTAAEQFRRADQLSPFGVALLTDSNELGTLAAAGQTVRIRQAELDYKWSKLAADRDEPTFGSVTKIVGDDGVTREVWPMYTQSGGVQLMPVGEGEQGDAMRRTIQQMQKVQDKMHEPDLSLAQYDKLDKQYEMLKQVFAKQLHTGGSTVQVQMQVPVQDPVTGEWILAPIGDALGGDKALRRGMIEAYYELGMGDSKQVQTDRSVMSSGNLALQTLKRLFPLMAPENVGMLGSVKRFTIATAQGVQGGEDLYKSIKGIITGEAPDLINSISARYSSPEFKGRLRRSLNDADLYRATLSTLAAIMAKFTDPDSAIRESEFDRILSELQGLGFGGAVSRLSEAETAVRTKMLLTKSRLDRAHEYATTQFGIPSRPADAPPDVARDILEPERIFPGVDIEIPGVNAPGLLSPQRQGKGQGATETQASQGQLDTRDIVMQEAKSLGINLPALDLSKQQKVILGVQEFLANNPQISEQDFRKAVRIILQRNNDR